LELIYHPALDAGVLDSNTYDFIAQNSNAQREFDARVGYFIINMAFLKKKSQNQSFCR
jgi:hypothetical protein